MQNKFYNFAAVALITIAVIATSYLFISKHSANASEEQSGQTKPAPMEVEVNIVTPQNVQLFKNFSGHVKAVDQAEIRPQVSGKITEIRFEDGQHVKKGDLLIIIDPSPYEAKLSQAKAALQAAQTQADLAEKEYQRAKNLIATEAISQSVLDERANSRQASLAAVQGAKAAVESAKIDLDYAYIKAPIEGKISRAEITEGNLVQPGANSPVLTNIVADKEVYVDFEVDERTYITTIQNGKTENISQVPVKIRLLDEDYKHTGIVHSFDNRIDPNSGTIRARAKFDNEDGILLPGMSVTVFMGSANDNEVILVPERAIGTDQDRKFVYVVGEDGSAQYREIKIGESVDGQRVILSGLKVGEQIITEGLVRIRPGMPVSPKQVLSNNKPATEKLEQVVKQDDRQMKE